jgi:predicted lipoprotein
MVSFCFEPIAPATVLVLSSLLFSTCRKPAPDEIVFTGRTNPAATTSGATGGPIDAAGGAGGDGAGTNGSATGSNGGAAGADGGAGGASDVEEPPCTAVTPAGGAFTKRKLLEQAADCAVFHYCEFELSAARLRDASAESAEEPSAANLAAAREAWRKAMSSWQRAEIFRFGPAAPMAEDPGGRDLRAPIYFFPLFSRCRVDEQTESRAYERAAFAASSFNARGLSALEYLLFYGGADNGCASHSDLNDEGLWDALGSTERARRKAAYAAVLGGDVLAGVGALREAWGSGGFRAELVGAGTGSSVYESEQTALNAVNRGLFYVEVELKDLKLGRPLGLTTQCSSPPCPEFVESPYALVSTQSMADNLVGFRRLFQGCGEDNEGVGFDDWLGAVGAADTAERMLAALDAAEAAVARLEPPFERALTENQAAALDVHTAVKGITDLLKSEMVSVLDLELPMGSEGDND